MNNHSRRTFLGQMFKGAALGLLGLFPGTFFNRGISFAAQSKDTLESVLKRVTKANLYAELNACTLTPEEKFAIASVKEIPRDELNRTINKIRIGEPEAEGSGYVCGHECGEYCGTGCGINCGDNCSVGFIDKQGALDIKINTINKPLFLSTLEKALNLIK